MQALKSHRLTLNRKRYSILAVFLLLAGCEGGIVGTGGGPKDTTIYELKELPDRISPDIPGHLEMFPEDPTDEQQEQPAIDKVTTSLRDSLTPTVRAESWEELNFELSIMAFLRLDAQYSITLTDLAIDDIISRCEQTIECVIPAGEIRVRYTQPVINRIVQSYVDTLGFPQLDEQDQSEYLRNIIGQLSQLLGSEVVFGEVMYSKLAGTPYEYRLKTSLTQLDTDRELTVQWRDDKSVAELVSRPLAEDDFSFALSLFYQANSPGESVIVKVENTSEGRTGTLNIKVITNGLGNDGILIEAHDVLLGASASSSGESVTSVSLTEADTGQGESSVTGTTETGTPEVVTVDTSDVDQYAYTFKTVRTLQGQIDNEGGYATVEEYDIPDDSTEPVDYVRLFRETFDGDGFLLAGEVCTEYSASNRCDTDTAFTEYGPGNAALVDSMLYYSPGDFSELESAQDAIRWQVTDLPTDIREFAVVAAETGTALSERPFLCVGFQIVPGNVQLFCGATDDQLSGSTEVISVAPGEETRLIPGARLTQVE